MIYQYRRRKVVRRGGRGDSAEWKEVSAGYVESVFRCQFVNFRDYLRCLHEGMIISTCIYDYRFVADRYSERVFYRDMFPLAGG